MRAVPFRADLPGSFAGVQCNSRSGNDPHLSVVPEKALDEAPKSRARSVRTEPSRAGLKGACAQDLSFRRHHLHAQKIAVGAGSAVLVVVIPGCTRKICQDRSAGSYRGGDVGKSQLPKLRIQLDVTYTGFDDRITVFLIYFNYPVHPSKIDKHRISAVRVGVHAGTGYRYNKADLMPVADPDYFLNLFRAAGKDYGVRTVIFKRILRRTGAVSG